jgi:hypothetical protein
MIERNLITTYLSNDNKWLNDDSCCFVMDQYIELHFL